MYKCIILFEHKCVNGYGSIKRMSVLVDSTCDSRKFNQLKTLVRSCDRIKRIEMDYVSLREWEFSHFISRASELSKLQLSFFLSSLSSFFVVSRHHNALINKNPRMRISIFIFIPKIAKKKRNKNRMNAITIAGRRINDRKVSNERVKLVEFLACHQNNYEFRLGI